MQDIHAIGGGGVGGGGRLFNGGVADRRLRPQHHHQNLQALKCPRCDSLNTKFCYYNNYNLSQPRHFCKSCRRYWTKGGVLRNVPVGGGCRKTKRSKPKQNASATTTEATDTGTLSAGPPPSQQQQPQERELISSNSHSSSESSSLTAAVTNATAEAVSAPSSSSASNNLFNGGIGESKLFGHPSMNQDFETGLMEQPGSDCGIFSEIGNFTTLIAPSNDQHLPFGFNMLNAQSLHDQLQLNQNQQWNPPPHKVVEMDGDGMKIPELAGGLMGDRTVQSELSALQNNRSGNSGGFGPLDWQGNGDQGLFDLPIAVDQTYWSHSHWATDQDHPSLYLP